MTKFDLLTTLEHLVSITEEIKKRDASSESAPISDKQLEKLLLRIMQEYPDDSIFLQTSSIILQICNKEQITVTQLNYLLLSMKNALFGICLAYVPKERSAYFEQEQLFGVAVKQSFPSASGDIKEAGNCFATGAFTATVFHLMRAVERVLHVLARDRGVPFPEDYNLRGWENLIDAIEGKVNEISDWPRGKTRADALTFYRGALGELRDFKEVWRNHVMHARGTYNEQQALSVMNHVMEFMQCLAGKLSEKRKAPLRWGNRR